MIAIICDADVESCGSDNSHLNSSVEFYLKHEYSSVIAECACFHYLRTNYCDLSVTLQQD